MTAVLRAAVLRAAGLEVTFGGVTALDRVAIEVAAGEVVGVVGANGAGKTTLLDCLSGHRRAAAGEVWLDGADVTRLGAARRARRGVIRSFADARLFPTMTGRDVLRLAGEEGRSRAPDGRSAPEGGAGLVAALDLEPHLEHRVAELSTGLRKRLGLACLAALRPRVLLVDEPSSGLAAAEVPGLTSWLHRLRDHTGAAMVLVDHELVLVWDLADRVVILDGGTVAAAGAPGDLREDPALSFARPS